MVHNNDKLIEELENIKFIINQRIGLLKFEDGFYDYLSNHKDDVKFEYCEAYIRLHENGYM